MLSQFTPDGSPHRPLREFGFPKGVYPLGRLDADSEGLLLLSDEPALNASLLKPSHRHLRTYWAQVERVPDSAAISAIAAGPAIQGWKCAPCKARMVDPNPEPPPRNPPIRFRKSIPTAWLELQLVEGKNRQVRRMTAAVGHPTLRLIRVAIGDFHLHGLPPGSWRELSAQERSMIFS